MDAISKLGLDIDTSRLVRAERDLDTAKRSTDALADRMDRLRDSVLKIGVAFGGAFAVGNIIKYADAWKNAENGIKTVTNSVYALRSAQQQVFDVAQKTYSSFEASARLFARVQRSAAEFVGGQREAVRLVETVNKALAVGGATTGEVQSTIIQLSQALSFGKLQGDEFRSIGENAPLIKDAIQKYVIETLGVARGEFKKFAAEGGISTEVMVKAIRQAGSAFDDAFKKLDPTIGQALTTLSNGFMKLIGGDGGPAFSALAASIKLLADNLGTLAKIAQVALAAFLLFNWQSIIAGVIGAATAIVTLTGNMVAFASASAAAGLTTGLIGKSIVGFKDSIALAALYIGDLVKSAGLLSVVMGGVVGALVIGGLALLAFSKDIVVAKEKLVETVQIDGEMREVSRDIKITLADIIDGMRDVLLGVKETAKTIVKDSAQAAAKEAQDATAKAGSAVDGIVKKTTDKTRESFLAVGSDARAMVNSVLAAFDSALAILDNAFRSFFLRNQLVINNLSTGLFQFFTDTANAAREWGRNLLAPLQDAPGLAGEMARKVSAALEGNVRIGRIVPVEAIEAEIAELDRRLGKRLQGNVGRDFVGEIARAASASARAREGGREDPIIATDPDPVVNDGALKRAKELLKQREAYNRLFDDLSAQMDAVDISSRELEIVTKQRELLKDFPLLYEEAADGAEKASRADASRLVIMERMLGVKTRLAEIRDEGDFAQQRNVRLQQSLRLGTQSYEVERKLADELDRMGATYADITTAQQEALENEIRRGLESEKVSDELERQFERLKDIADAPVQNLQRGLEEATDQFAEDFLSKGLGAVRDFTSNLGSTLKKLAADVLRQVLDPFMQKIRNGITDALGIPRASTGATVVISGGVSAGGGASGGAAGEGAYTGSGGVTGTTSLLSGIKAIFGVGGSGGASASAGFSGVGLARAGSAYLAARGADASGGIGSTLTSIGFANGGVNPAIGRLLENVLGKVGLSKALGSSITAGFNKIFSPGSALGSLIGSGAANALGLVKKEKGGQVGGAVGGTIGAFVGGPIGSAVGSFIGSIIGGLFGPKPTNAAAGADLDRSGTLLRTEGSKATEETLSLVSGAAGRVKEGQDLLKQMGATLTTTVSKLVIGVRDASQFYLSNDPGRVNYVGQVGDPNALASGALAGVLKGAKFDNPVIQGVADAMGAAGKSFESTIKVLGTLKDILPDTTAATSQWQVALKQIKDTFADLQPELAGLGDAAQQVADAFMHAREALRDSLDKEIADAITAIDNPVQAQLEALLKTQAQRIADVANLGGFMPNVQKLNSKELAAFIENAGGTADAFVNLNKVIADLLETARKAGQDIAPLQEAFAAAREGVVGAFNDDIEKSLLELTNPTLAALQTLMTAQSARLKQARDLGANIVAVERLNANEQRAFFAGLTEEQKLALGDYLGMVENFTGKVTLALASLGDALSAQIDDVQNRSNDLRAQADNVRGLADGIRDTRQSLIDQFGAASPRAGVDALRARFQSVAEDARAGNESALTALPQVADLLVQKSRELYGSTTSFRTDFDYVTKVLGEVEAAARTQATGLDGQAETLIQQRDLLIQIRDTLNQPDPALAALQSALDKLDDGNKVISEKLGEYLRLVAARDAQTLNFGDLQAAAVASITPAATPTVAAPPIVGPNSFTSPTPAANTNTPQPAPTPTPTAGDSQLAGQIALLTDTTDAGNQLIVAGIDEMRRDQRRLYDLLLRDYR